jgi:hypothetical protein
MTVEAYIVPKMNAPFILGTDFASQFQLSLIRDNSGTRIQFGDTGRSIKVEESESSPQVNSSGTFKVEISTFYSSNKDRRKKSKKLHSKRRKDKTLPLGSSKVKSLETIVIPPETIKKIKVKTQFNPDQEEGFVQRDFGFYRNQDNVYAVADCLIATAKPELQIANFSKRPITIQANQTLGIMDKSNKNMPRLETLSEHELTSCFNYALLVKAIAKKKAELIPVELKDLQEGEAIGPKTAKLPSTETVPSERLIQEINFSETLSSKQRKELEKVVLKHEQAFGLDGRLGSHDTKVEIKLREGTKEIS